jgi:DNA helicase II / ATP-dependent DNA helicase PcrA
MTHQHLADLNQNQREAATFGQALMILAGPGSGKTKTMAAKAAFLLEQDQSATVLAVTFTRDAARELQERMLRAALVTSPDAADRLIVGTFHSSCAMLADPHNRRWKKGERIRSAMAGKKLAKFPPVVSTGEQISIVVRAANRVGIPAKERAADLLKSIELVKARDFASGQLHPAAFDLTEAYQELLLRAGKMDFQDMIIFVADGLRDRIIDPLPTTHILVDEAQDTDALQYQIIESHVAAGTVPTLVGDDDQTIYGFRRARGFDGLQQFSKMVSAHQIVLDYNYRSHEEIVHVATRLMNNGPFRVPKHLIAFKGPGGNIQAAECADVQEEAKIAAKWAAAVLKTEKSCAVLARFQRQLDAMEGAMRVAQVPYLRAEGDSLLSRPVVVLAIKLAQASVQVAVAPVDMALAWHKVSEHDLELIHRAAPSKITRVDASVLSDAGVSKEASIAYRLLATRMSQWQEAAKNKANTLVAAGIVAYLTEAKGIEARDASLLPIIRELLVPKPGVALAVHLARLLAPRDSGHSESACVVLSTAHASKGLEYDHVFVAGLQNGTFPAKDSPIDEERRLLYVAMTRAREGLYLSAVLGFEAVRSPFWHESGLNEYMQPTVDAL